uniref:hypothetical protein n=1 Tax=Nonomuraea sp. CA-251285 TaxID=3240002 RepID=UPI003F495EA7
MRIHRDPILQITTWLAREVGDAPDSPNTIPWRIAKIMEEVGEAHSAHLIRDLDALRAELCDIILTSEVAAFSIDPDSLPRSLKTNWAWERSASGYLTDIVIAAGHASAALFGMAGRNPRKGTSHTPRQALQALHDLSAAAANMLAALSHPGGPQSTYNNHVNRVVQRAGIQREGSP